MSPAARFINTRIAILTVAAGLLAGAGCQPKTTHFRVTAFGETGAGEVFVEKFPDGAFTRNALGNYRLAFELPPKRMPIRPAIEVANGQPDDSTGEDRLSEAAPDIVANQPPAAPQVPEEVYIAQFVLIDLLWHADPGTTFADSSQTNAGLTYCLIRGGDTVRYEGAGFVYFTLDRDGASMTGRIESATLYPTKATSESVDVLGPCRLTAEFVARKCARGVTAVERKLIGPVAAHSPTG